VELGVVTPERAEVLRLLDVKGESPGQRRWLAAVDELAALLPRLVRGRAAWRIDPVRKLRPGVLELGSNAVFRGAVGEFLKHSTFAATFLVTLGSALERLSRGWLRRGQIMRGTVLDALGAETAEATAQRCQDEVRAWARERGLEITPRYSPGYCGLDLRQQRMLFASLPAERINVRLTESCLMVPIKSVSGLIGIGPAGLVSPDACACVFCGHPDCRQRRAPYRWDCVRRESEGLGK